MSHRYLWLLQACAVIVLAGVPTNDSSFDRPFVQIDYPESCPKEPSCGAKIRDNTMLDNLMHKRTFSSHIKTKSLFTENQVFAIQLTSTILAGVSFCCTLFTFYWFTQMKKKFRHKLIVMLFTADVMRSFWLFTFPLVSYARTSPIPSASGFCQASGFFLQWGLELADYTILCMAVHTALQIFKPDVSIRGSAESGLYRYRYLVFAGAVVIPPTLCSLAYVRGPEGYMSVGPSCGLPLRPFWYRLAISWIPRYTVMLAVVSLYIAIYIYVGRHFGAFQRMKGRKQSARSTTFMSTTGQGVSRRNLSTSGQSTRSAVVVNPPDLAVGDSNSPGQQQEATEPDQPDEKFWHEESSRKESNGTTLYENRRSEGSLARFLPINGSVSHSNGTEQGSKDALDNGANGEPKAVLFHGDGVSAEADEREKTPKRRAGSQVLMGRKIMTKEMSKVRASIQHQVRLLFIYPLCYFSMWIIPFANHVCNYNNYLVQNPIFVMSLLSYACVSGMGAVDSLVFTLREQPWKHIPGSDGTFLGSFLCWRHDPNRRASNSTNSGDYDDQQFPQDRHASVLSSETPTSRDQSPHGKSRQESHASSTNRPSIGTRGRTISGSRIQRVDGRTEMRRGSQNDELVDEADEEGITSLDQDDSREVYWFDRNLSRAVGRRDFGSDA